MHKAEDYRDALALIAEADRRATATMIEHIAAAALFKLAPPEEGAVATLTISISEISDLLLSHHFEAEYDDEGTMTLFLTPITQK